MCEVCGETSEIYPNGSYGCPDPNCLSNREYVERKTISGRVLKQYGLPVHIKITTRVPGKWLFVDEETGHVWEYVEGRFKSADEQRVKDLRLIIERNEAKDNE